MMPYHDVYHDDYQDDAHDDYYDDYHDDYHDDAHDGDDTCPMMPDHFPVLAFLLPQAPSLLYANMSSDHFLSDKTYQ